MSAKMQTGCITGTSQITGSTILHHQHGTAVYTAVLNLVGSIINRDKKRNIYGFGKIYGVGKYIRSGKIYTEWENIFEPDF
jgi:hypothetical protein